METTAFAPEPERPGALPYLAPDPGAYSTALAGDGLDWLGAMLPPPKPLICSRHRRPMRLPAVPLLWKCPTCDNAPGDTRDESA